MIMIPWSTDGKEQFLLKNCWTEHVPTVLGGSNVTNPGFCQADDSPARVTLGSFLGLRTSHKSTEVVWTKVTTKVTTACNDFRFKPTFKFATPRLDVVETCWNWIQSSSKSHTAYESAYPMWQICPRTGCSVGESPAPADHNHGWTETQRRSPPAARKRSRR